MDSHFDKAALSLLIKRALGNRTQKSFAEDIQLSKEHLSRLIQQKRDTPPTIDTLGKIAANSQNTVSIKELLSVCGYDPNTVVISAAARRMTDALQLAFRRLPYTFSYLPCKNTDFYQLALQFSDGPIRRWYFHFLSETTFKMVDNELAANYLYLISNKTETEDKISFVTSFPLLYQYYVEHRPYNLNLNLSLVLISENTLTVSQETLLQTASSVHENVLKRYMFLNPD
ncbi:helix-turn-helix transcriptional regulator [Lachnospiraceae bacterium 29-91]